MEDAKRITHEQRSVTLERGVDEIAYQLPLVVCSPSRSLTSRESGISSYEVHRMARRKDVSKGPA